MLQNVPWVKWDEKYDVATPVGSPAFSGQWEMTTEETVNIKFEAISIEWKFWMRKQRKKLKKKQQTLTHA